MLLINAKEQLINRVIETKSIHLIINDREHLINRTMSMLLINARKQLINRVGKAMRVC